MIVRCSHSDNANWPTRQGEYDEHTPSTPATVRSTSTAWLVFVDSLQATRTRRGPAAIRCGAAEIEDLLDEHLVPEDRTLGCA